MSLMAGMGMAGAIFGAFDAASKAGGSAAQIQEELKKSLKNAKLITSFLPLLSPAQIFPIF